MFQQVLEAYFETVYEIHCGNKKQDVPAEMCENSQATIVKPDDRRLSISSLSSEFLEIHVW